MENAEADLIAAETSICIDASCFDRDVIYRATYLLTDRAWMWLTPAEDGIAVHLTARPGEDAQSLVHELGNHLIDQALRKDIAKETGDLRRMLLQRALS